MPDVLHDIAAVTSAAGVTDVFGVMGDGNLHYVDALSRGHAIRYVAAAREDGAVLMADGYARATGRTGVATVTHGPGLTNAATALVEGVRSRTPLVLVAADTASDAVEHPQRLDQEAFVAGTGAGWVRVTSARRAAAAAERAFHLAGRERRPVVLDVPVSGLPEHDESSSGPLRPLPADDPPTHAADADLAAAVEAVSRAERIVVLAGRGAVLAGARDALSALAEGTGALLATTLLAKDFFSGEPFDVGVCGGFASDPAMRELRQVDCVLAFGASLNRFTTDGGALFRDAVVVQCDDDAGAFGRYRPADVRLHGDARVVAEQLGRALDGVPRRGARTDALAAQLAGHDVAREFQDASDETGMDLRTLAVQLDRLVPDDRLLVVDGGHAALSEPARTLRLKSPRDLVFALGFGSIGLGLGMAVGAAVARPGRPVVTAVGDGGFLMSLVELDTAVRERLPVLAVVHNDGAYGYEWHNMVRMGLPTTHAEFARPDFAAIARAWGADGVTVRTPADLEALAPMLRRVAGPVVLDVHLTRRVKTTWFARHEG